MLTIAFDLDGTLWPMKDSLPRDWKAIRELYITCRLSDIWRVIIITAGNDVARVKKSLERESLPMPNNIIVCSEGVSKKMLYAQAAPHLVIDDKESCCLQAIEAGAFALQVR